MRISGGPASVRIAQLTTLPGRDGRRFDAAFAAHTVGASASTNDVRTMGPSQMDGFAQRLYNDGKVNLTQLFKLQNAGPLRTSDPHGRPAHTVDRDTPMDYVAYVKDQMAGIASRGGVDDPKAGYRDWSAILSVLQGTAA